MSTPVRSIVLLSILSLFLTACSKTPSDAQIRQRAVGAWEPSVKTRSGHGRFVNEMRADGTFVSKMSAPTNEIELAGTWEVQGGVITMTLTNAKGVDASALGPPVQSYKVVRITKDEITCRLGSNTNLFVMTRR